MKFFIFIFIFLLSAINLFCAEKTPVLIMFNNCDKQYEYFIKNGIEDVITKNGYSIIDSQIQENALKEQEKQHKSICYDESCLVDTGKMVAAKYILFIDKNISNTTVFYKMKFIDIETGENILSKTITQNSELKEEEYISLGKKFSEEIIIQQSTNNNIEKLKNEQRHQIMIFINSEKHSDIIKNGVEEILTKKSYSIIDEVVQKEALKEQAEQRKKECYDESCIVETGKMLSAKYLFIINISSVSNGLMFTIKYINTETNEVLLTKSKIYKDDIENTEELFIFSKKITTELFEENNNMNIIEFKTKEEIEKYNAFKKQEELKLKNIENEKIKKANEEAELLKQQQKEIQLEKERKTEKIQNNIKKIVYENFNTKSEYKDNKLFVIKNNVYSPLSSNDEIIKIDDMNIDNYELFNSLTEKDYDFKMNNIEIKRNNILQLINYDEFIYNSLFKSYFGIAFSGSIYIDNTLYFELSIPVMNYKKKFYEITIAEISLLKGSSDKFNYGLSLGDFSVNYKVLIAGIKLFDYSKINEFTSWTSVYGGLKININNYYFSFLTEMKYSTKDIVLENIDYYGTVSHDNQEKNGFQFGGMIKIGYNYTVRD